MKCWERTAAGCERHNRSGRGWRVWVKFDFSFLMLMAVAPRFADVATGGSTAEVLGFVFLCFRPRNNVPSWSQRSFFRIRLFPCLVPVRSCLETEFWILTRVHPLLPGSAYSWSRDMVNRIIDGHRWTHRMRTFRRELRQSLRASVDWSDPYSVRSPSPWSSDFDSSDSEVQ